MATLNIEFGIPEYDDRSLVRDNAVVAARCMFEKDIHEINGDYGNIYIKFDSNNFSFIKLRVLKYVFAIRDLFDKAIFGRIIAGIIKANNFTHENNMILVDDTRYSGILITLNINEKHVKNLEDKKDVSSINCKFNIAEYPSTSYEYYERSNSEFEDARVRYRGSLNRELDLHIFTASSCFHDTIMSVVRNIMKFDDIEEVTKLSIVYSIIDEYMNLNYEISDDGNEIEMNSCCKSSKSVTKYNIGGRVIKN
ncbi:MAG: hypothetical protein IKL53_11340 [Lachnospiraceae bacterium]|nr:hypothetical protein [Lachnospiraceae bacterium]